MYSPGDKYHVDIDGEAILVTLVAPLSPDDARKLGRDGFHVTYEEGDKEGTGGSHRRSELKSA